MLVRGVSLSSEGIRGERVRRRPVGTGTAELSEFQRLSDTATRSYQTYLAVGHLLGSM